MRTCLVIAVVASMLTVAPVAAQLAVIEKGKPMTLRGEVVEISCYQKKGVTAGTGAAHVTCAKDCVKQGKALGILSDGDGLFRIVGNLTQDNNAKLVPHIGQIVEVTGAEVFISNNYDVKSFEVQRITPIKKG